MAAPGREYYSSSLSLTCANLPIFIYLMNWRASWLPLIYRISISLHSKTSPIFNQIIIGEVIQSIDPSSIIHILDLASSSYFNISSAYIKKSIASGLLFRMTFSISTIIIMISLSFVIPSHYFNSVHRSFEKHLHSVRKVSLWIILMDYDRLRRILNK